MSFNHKYRTLCTVNLYHQYFLNDGVERFDNLANPDLKKEQLEKYNVQSFLQIKPTERTKKLMSGQKIVMKQNRSGFVLWIQAEDTITDGIYKPKIDVSQTDQFDFLLYVTDPLFENYSTVVGVPDIPFYFSNKKPATELGVFSEINIETDIPQTPIEDYDITAFTYETVSEKLSSSEKKGLFGIISLSVQADTASNSLLDTSGLTQATTPTFKVQLRNRETFWSYLDATDGTLIHKSPTLLPLVQNGIVGYTFDTTAKRASAEPNRLVFVKDGSGTIIETISEIFISN
ncbi:hypothetical protein [Flavivirga jejuensis]|uniref:Uncharacterized protein n=1 Tax=Flavivirga jejuensis TaxID=870487 RepID=A0ABT8WQB8_9FLAO|nr:hypothetical protein [Flavivirga jejuensis]MDO5975220.1 hypothetical protein [Flavivirga jejuensis]